MTLQEGISSYYLYLKHERKVSQSSYKCYHACLNRFLEWVINNGYPEPTIQDLSTPLIRRYLHFSSELGLRPRGIKSRLVPIKGLCAFLVSSEKLSENPALPVKLPKMDAAERVVATEAEIKQLLEAVEKIQDPRRKALTRAMLSVLIFTGIRRDEVCNLKMEDVDVEKGCLTIRHGKGDKARLAYICSEGRAAIKEWLALREKDSRCPYLFTVDRARRVYYKGLYNMLEETKAIAGLSHNKGLLPHSLRHSAATRLLRNGADIKSIQSFLGHSDMKTTAVYLRTADHRLAEIAHLQSLSTSKKKETNGSRDADKKRVRKDLRKRL
jgi:site-specific recombinase XerD